MSTKDKSAFYDMIANYMLKNLKIKLFITKTVGEVLSGYDDPFMKMAKNLDPNLPKDGKFSFNIGVKDLATFFLF